jgi:hypothetical protein
MWYHGAGMAHDNRMKEKISASGIGSKWRMAINISWRIGISNENENNQ